MLFHPVKVPLKIFVILAKVGARLGLNVEKDTTLDTL
jgi:hypothetical protein